MKETPPTLLSARENKHFLMCNPLMCNLNKKLTLQQVEYNHELRNIIYNGLFISLPTYKVVVYWKLGMKH